MHRLRMLFLAGALALVATAHAQTGLGGIVNQAQNAMKNFDIADKNRDGLLTRQEAEDGPVPFIRAHFDAIDKNHRGAVSKQDVADYLQSLHRTPAAAASSGH
ncbi:EF-hand domain-containing protein [Dyella sedimenti]|uniref:EF-hand domain-containing protein n=1 Tax=Dyella sedimenti TaxID=2919947 RepID=UPI001FAA0ED2|nr:EF-hand domain-containing protein [Dyella sedimenti]